MKLDALRAAIQAMEKREPAFRHKLTEVVDKGEVTTFRQASLAIRGLVSFGLKQTKV